MKIIKALCIMATINCMLSLTASEVKINITMDPAGDFDAVTSKVEGKLLHVNGEVSAEKISVNLNDFDCGIFPLRKTHFIEYVQNKQPTPIIEVTQVKGKANKASAKIKINGISKDISFNYKIDGKVASTKFELNVEDFGLKPREHVGLTTEKIVTLSIKMDL